MARAARARREGKRSGQKAGTAGARRPTQKRGPRAEPSLLQSAGSTLGQVLRDSTDAVKDAGSGLVNTAREAITSALTMQHDAVSVLKRQHREVEGLFKQVLSAAHVERRRQLLQEITRALAMHTSIEEKIFYPAVRSLGTEAVKKLLDESLEEHHVVDLVLAELPKINPENARFTAKMTVLSEVVGHHVKEEESDMFKRAQELGKNRLEQLGAGLEAAAARYQKSAAAGSR